MPNIEKPLCVSDFDRMATALEEMSASMRARAILKQGLSDRLALLAKEMRADSRPLAKSLSHSVI